MSSIEYVDGWPQPYRLPDAEPYWKALNEGRLTYQRCDECQEAVWPAHSACPHCGSRRLAWHEASGRGTLYSFSTVVRGPTPAWQAISPYHVGFVEMPEGYYLFSQIEARAEDLAVGKPVRVRFIQRGSQTLPVFALE